MTLPKAFPCVVRLMCADGSLQVAMRSREDSVRLLDRLEEYSRRLEVWPTIVNDLNGLTWEVSLPAADVERHVWSAVWE